MFAVGCSPAAFFCKKTVSKYQDRTITIYFVIIAQ